MTNSYLTFKRNIDSINTIDNLYVYFNSQVKALDLSEILRAQYVLIVSSFDYYIHDIVKEGMLKIFEGQVQSNSNYEQFSISLNALQSILLTTDQNQRKQILDNEIRKITSKDTYQAPANVEKALGLIDLTSIWSTISPEIGKSAKDIKAELGLIVHRRNKIAHEADINPLTNSKFTIERSTLIEVKEFIIKIVEAIDNKI